MKTITPLQQAIVDAESGLKWSDHKDFARVYTALEKVHKFLMREDKKIDSAETPKNRGL